MHRIFKKISHFFNGNWRLAVLDLTKGRWLVSLDNLAYLKAENASGRHIIIQPGHEVEPYYLLVDDLNAELLWRHHKINNIWKPGRMVIETSPANYQVWIHSSRSLNLHEKQYWLKKLHNDPGASPKNRWGRCPGFFNRKPKYRTPNGNYPLSKLIWVDWKKTVNIPTFSLNQDFKKKTIDQRRFSLIPRGDVCHINRADYERGDESATDFAYSLALARRRVPIEEIKIRLLAERTNWKNHFGNKRKECYLDRTIAKAINIVESDAKIGQNI